MLALLGNGSCGSGGDGNGSSNGDGVLDNCDDDSSISNGNGDDGGMILVDGLIKNT